MKRLAAEREGLEEELVRNALLVAKVEKEIEQHTLRKRERKRDSRADLRRERKAKTSRARRWKSGALAVKIFLNGTAPQENCEKEATSLA